MNGKTIAKLFIAGLLAIGIAPFASAQVSDDFDEPSIKTNLWTIEDVGGNSGACFGTVQTVGYGSGNAELAITVPNCDSHDAYVSDTTVHLMQPVNDTDFTIEAKFDSLPNASYEFQGIMFEDVNNLHLRFDAGITGISGSAIQCLAAICNGGYNGLAGPVTLPAPFPNATQVTNNVGKIYMRVNRQGNVWTVTVSPDGVVWTQIYSPITNSFVPIKAGVYAGNAGPNPGWTSLVDYFFNTASPVTNEDSAGRTSDDFNEDSLNTNLWTVVDHGGGSGASFGSVSTVGANSGDAVLQIVVPAGDNHAGYIPNNLIRVMQAVTTNGDFSYTAKFETMPANAYEESGIIFSSSTNVDSKAEQTTDLIFDTINGQSGTGIGNWAAYCNNQFNYKAGSPSTLITPPFPTSNLITNNLATEYVRIQKQGNVWTESLSQDGVTWIQPFGPVTLSDFAPTYVGVFAGNGGNNPGWTNRIDYFFNDASPIENEDGLALENPPGISITNPPPFSFFQLHSNISVTAAAIPGEAGASITNIKIFEDGTQIASANNTNAVAFTVVNAALGTHSFTAIATDNFGKTNVSSAVVVTVVSSSGAILSDDFDGATLKSMWTQVDPIGGATYGTFGFGTTNVDLAITVPEGIDHESSANNTDVRLMQSVTNQDFSVTAKLDTVPSSDIEEEGILVEGADGVGIAFKVLDHFGQQVLHWQVVQGTGSPTLIGSEDTVEDVFSDYGTTNVAGTIYLRVQHSGIEWTYSTSPDNETWTQRADFTNGLVMNKIGITVGNGNSFPPGWTPLVDYFFNDASPIAVEDPLIVKLNIATSGNQVVLSWPVSAAGYTLQTATSLTGAWTTVPGLPTVLGDQNTMTLPSGTGTAFYRLKAP